MAGRLGKLEEEEKKPKSAGRLQSLGSTFAERGLAMQESRAMQNTQTQPAPQAPKEYTGNAINSFASGVFSGVSGIGSAAVAKGKTIQQGDTTKTFGVKVRTPSMSQTIGSLKLIQGALEGTEFMKKLREISGKKVEETGESVQESFGKLAESQKNKVDPNDFILDERGEVKWERFKEPEALLNSVALGVGSMIPAAAVGVATKSPAAFGMAMGIQEKGDAYETYINAIKAKNGGVVTEQDARLADEMSDYYGVMSMFLETAMPAQFLKNIGGDKVAKGIFMRAITQVPLETMRSVFTEGVTEGTQRFTQNLLAKYSGINPDQDLMEGVAGEAVMGGITGAPFGVVGGIAPGKSDVTTASNIGQNYSEEAPQQAPAPTPAPTTPIAPKTPVKTDGGATGTVQEDGTVKLETPLEIGGKSIDTVPFNSNWTPLEKIAETEAKMTRDKLVEDDLIAAAERKSEKVDAPKVEAEKPVVEAPKQEKAPVIDAPKVETVKPEEIPPVKAEVSSASDYVEKFIKGDAELSGKVAKYKRSSNGDGTFVYTDLGTGSNGKPRYATYWFGDTDLKEGGKEALDEMKGMMVNEIASRDAEKAKSAEKKKTVVSKKKPVYIDKTPDKIVSIKETGHQVGDKVMFDGKEHSITSVLKKGVGEAKFELTDDKGKKIWTNKGGLEDSKKATASLFAPPVGEKTIPKSTVVTTKKSDTSAETAKKNKEDAYSKMKRLMDEGYKEDEEGELWTSDLIDKYSDEAADALGKIGFRLDFNDQFDSYEISLKDKSVSMKEAQEMFVDLAAAWEFKLDTNADGTISMFHGTSEENALSILENGFEPGVFFSPGVDEYYGGVNGASYYGKAVLKADIDPRGLLFRTEGEFYTDDEDAIRNVRAESVVDKGEGIILNEIPFSALEGAMQHRPTRTGAFASDISQDASDMGIPDFYEHPEWYHFGGKEYDESINALMRVKGSPEKVITIYRASPKNELRIGDWVTLSREKARLESLQEGTSVHSFKVKAKEIEFAGDDITEFGYWGEQSINEREIPAMASAGQKTEQLKWYIGNLQKKLRTMNMSENAPAKKAIIKAIKVAEDEVIEIRRRGAFTISNGSREGNPGGKTYFDRDAEGMKHIFFALVGDGTISFQDYKKLEYVIDTFKGNINDVALYFGEPGSRAGAGGEYNPYTRVISLYESISGGNAEHIMDTFFHEIMHPGERYLSKETVAKLTKHFKKVQAEAFGRYPGLKEAVKKRDLTYFNKEGHGDRYRFYSISEYIAETGREKTWRTLAEQDRDVLDAEKHANKEISAIVRFVAQLWRNFLRFMRKYKNIDERVYAELMAGRTAKQRELAFWEAEGIDLRDGDREQVIRQVAAMHRDKIPRGKMQWIDRVLKDGMTDSEIATAVDALIRATVKSASPITPASFNAGASANAISAKRLEVDSKTLITPVKRKRYTDLIEQMGGLIAAEKVMQTQLASIPKYYDEMEHQYSSFVTLFKKYPSAREVLTSSDVGGIKDRLEAVMPRAKVDDIFYSSEENIHADDVLNDFRDTLSKENPDLFYGQKQAAALGYSKEKSSFKRAMRNLEEGGSAYSEEYMALKNELDAIQAESRGYRAELAEQMAKDTFTFTTKNLREHGLILPRKTVISKKQVENQKKTAFVSGIKKGVKIGVKSGMAYMREIAEDKALSIAEKKKRIVAYAKDSLPIARRGGILSLVANAKTEKDVLKAIGRIDRVAEQTRSKAIIAEIKKVVARVMKTESIDIGYKERISALIDGFNLQNRRRDTIDRLSATKQYIARQQAEGKTADIPKRVQKAIEDLDKTLISSMNEADLMTLLSEIAYLEEIGKNKLKTRRAIYEMKRDRMKEELVESTVRMEASPVLRALPGEAPLTIQEKLKNLVPKTINFFSKVDKYISPVDVIFDILDGSQGFVGTNYRLFKRNLDVKFGKFLDRKDVHQSPVKDYADKHKMTVQQYERVGIHAARVQEGGMEKLANNGLTEEYIESIELTDVEMGLYTLMREHLDALRPDIERIMRTVYNKPLEKVDNYFSFMTDFDQVSDVEVLERIVNAQEVGQGKTKTVKKGFTLSRIGAGNQKIKVNAMDIYLKHTENASYLVEMAESIQMLSEIANSQEYLEASGEFGAQLVREWLDTMARKGGLLGDQQIEWLDKMRVNLGAAVLGFKLTAALIQPTALFNGASIIGNYAFTGANNITDQRWRTFLKQFPELRDRMADDPSYLESGFKSLEKVQRYGYMPLQKLDSITASAIVSGAYQKYMDEHGKTVSLDGAPDPDGVNYAETVLRRTQSSAFFKDIPLVITRGKVGGRTFTKALLQFQSFLLNAWSLLRHEGVRRGIGQKKFTDASRIFMWTGVSILGATAIREGVKQALAALTGDDDDDKTFAEKYLKEALGYIPFISQGMSLFSYGSFPVPALSIGNDLYMATGQIQGKRSDTQMRGWIRAGAVFGKLFGIPGTVQTQQILNDLTYK